MSKQSTEHLAKFEAVFKRFLDSYMLERNIASLKELLSEDFCGYGTGLDENVYNKDKGIEIFQRDISSNPHTLHYTLNHYDIKLLDQYNAIIVSQLELKTKIKDQDLKMNNLRMMMLLHEEDSTVKISGIHISFPTKVHEGDESYPLKELEKRTKVLNRLVEKKTNDLQIAITKLKQSEEALRESEGRFRVLVDTTPDYIYTFDREGRHTAVNRSTCRDMGLEEHEIIGKNHMELGFPEKICNEWQELHHRVFSYKQVLKEETSTPMADGTIHTYEVVLTPIFHEDGSVKGIHGMSRDITDRKKKEDELRKQKERFANTLEGTNAGTWEWNIQTGEVIINERWAEIIGFTLEELSPITFETWMKFTHQDDLQVSNNMLEKHFTGELEYYDVECRMRHKKGHWVWIQDRGKVISWTEKGKPLWMFGTHQDITHRKQVEEEHAKLSSEYETVFHSTQEPMFLVEVIDGETFSFIRNNLAYSRATGIESKEIQGKTPEDLLGEELGNKVRSNYKRCVQKQEPILFEETLPLPEGTRIWSTLLTPVIKDEEVYYIVGSSRDITESKQTEDMLKEYKERLSKAQAFAHAGTWEYHINDRSLYWSKECELLFGLDEGEFEGTFDAFLKQVHPDDKEYVENMNRPITENREGIDLHYEHRIIKKDGTVCWVKETAGAVKDNSGEPLKIVGFVMDISERKQIEEKMQYQNEFQKVVANISYSFINTQSSQMDEAINNTLYQVGNFFHVDRSYLIMFSSDDMFVSNTHEWCREGIEPQKDKIQVTPVDSLPWIIKEIRSKEFVFIPDVDAIYYKEEREEYQRQCIQSLLLLPIKFKERVVGLIGMDAVTKKMVWTDEEITLLKVISEIMSSAFLKHQIETELIQQSQEVDQLNQHLNKEIDKAHRIHNNILPKKLPTIKGVNFAAYYQPAEILGGDFYDIIQVDNKLVIYLSDISGHGLDGSMINFFVKESIDSYIALKPGELSPRSILRHLEQQFRLKNQPDDLFISIFLAVLNVETMELTYTGAGFQDTPYVKQGNGEQEILRTKGLFINSIFPVDRKNFQEKTITLTSGSTVFFNTDGLTEQGEPGAFYRDRLSHVFYKNAHLTPNKISQAIIEDFKSFNNGSLQGTDDITFLVLQIEPENRRHQIQLDTDYNELEYLREIATGILPDVAERVVLISCLYELTANAIEHGNQMDPTKKVFVEFVVYHDYMQVSVEDEGEGFNWRDKVNKPMELEGHSERGRGIPMTRILSNSLYYNCEGNKVTCVVESSKGD